MRGLLALFPTVDRRAVCASESVQFSRGKIASGGNAHLVKPVQLDEILQTRSTERTQDQ